MFNKLQHNIAHIDKCHTLIWPSECLKELGRKYDLGSETVCTKIFGNYYPDCRQFKISKKRFFANNFMHIPSARKNLTWKSLSQQGYQSPKIEHRRQGRHWRGRFSTSSLPKILKMWPWRCLSFIEVEHISFKLPSYYEDECTTLILFWDLERSFLSGRRGFQWTFRERPGVAEQNDHNRPVGIFSSLD